MLHSLNQFFDHHIRPLEGEAGRSDPHRLQVATAALLIEVMRADRQFREAERQAVTAAVRERFELTTAETADLLELAEVEAREATDYYRFTALINQHFTPAEKEQIVELLWRVASADLEIDRFERTLVHKIADLLHVPRPAQIAARARALRGARST
jgi:uncharacterized tellurite resistance protein B-like protein